MIEVKVSSERALVKLQALPQQMRAALIDEMKRQWFRLQSEIVTGKLSGDPLRRRTGTLASSINVGGADTVTAFDESPLTILGRVGTRVRYARVHEYGGTVEVKAHSRRSPGGKEVAVRAHTATFPERSFIRSTMRTMRDEIRAALEAAVHRAVA